MKKLQICGNTKLALMPLLLTLCLCENVDKGRWLFLRYVTFFYNSRGISVILRKKILSLKSFLGNRLMTLPYFDLTLGGKVYRPHHGKLHCTCYVLRRHCGLSNVRLPLFGHIYNGLKCTCHLRAQSCHPTTM